MANKTSIEWTDYNWNFLRGCSRVSEGCRNCYAEGVAARFSGDGMAYEGLAEFRNHQPRWTGSIRFLHDTLIEPLKWKRPRKVFVNSMSDLFHELVTDEMLDKAFAVMALTLQHTYQILTKRPERMKAYLTGSNFKGRVHDVMGAMTGAVPMHVWEARLEQIATFPNVWLGVSVEDQKTADERIPLLLQTPAAIRWISAEPLLDAIELTAIARQLYVSRINALTGVRYYDHRSEQMARLDWVAVGGESGPRARETQLFDIRAIVQQCQDFNVPVFVKQLGGNLSDADLSYCQRTTGISIQDKKGGDPLEWPEEFQVREYPEMPTATASQGNAAKSAHSVTNGGDR